MDEVFANCLTVGPLNSLTMTNLAEFLKRDVNMSLQEREELRLFAVSSDPQCELDTITKPLSDDMQL